MVEQNTILFYANIKSNYGADAKNRNSKLYCTYVINQNLNTYK